MPDEKVIAFVGDLMFKEKSVPMYLEKDGNYQFDVIFEDVKESLNKIDYMVGNLETTVSDYPGDAYTVDVNFNAPVEFLHALKRAGFDYVGTGNNHCLNKGVRGLKRTLENIDKAGLEHGGTYSNPEASKKYNIVQIGNCKIAIMSYTYGTNTLKNKCFLDENELGLVNLFQEQQYPDRRMLWFASNKFFAFRWMYRLYATFHGQEKLGEQSERTEENARCRAEIHKQIQMIKEEKPDYIIMLMHAGGRYSKKPSRWVVDIVDFLKREGVDIIIGHHNHRVQPCYVNDDSSKLNMVAYDVGNFCSTTGVVNGPYNKLSEISLLLKLYIREDKIVRAAIVPCTSMLNKNHKVVIRTVQKAYDYLDKKQCKELENKVTQMLKIFGCNQQIDANGEIIFWQEKN